MKQLIIEMDEDTKKKFRQITVNKNTSMAKVVRACIDHYITENTRSIVY